MPHFDARLGWPAALLIIEAPSDYFSPGRTPAPPKPLSPYQQSVRYLTDYIATARLPHPFSDPNAIFDDVPF